MTLYNRLIFRASLENSRSWTGDDARIARQASMFIHSPVVQRHPGLFCNTYDHPFG